MKSKFNFLSVLLLILPSIVFSQPKKMQKRAYQFISTYFATQETNVKLSIDVLTLKSDFYNLDSMLNLTRLQNDRFPLMITTDSIINIHTVLNETDLDCMRKQMELWQNHKTLDVNKLKNIQERLLFKDIRTELEKNLNRITTYKIFYPLFSCKGDIVLFYAENYCGMECGGGQLTIYKIKPNGEWKILGVIPTWIS